MPANPYRLIREAWIPAPLKTVFGFFYQAENLQKLTPPWLDFEIRTPRPVQMKQGTLIDYSLKLYGVRINWRSEITRWQPPNCFVDTQLSGPYKLWVHTHTFAERNGGTWMQDQVEYLPRGGLLAPLINRWFVAPSLNQIFEYRKRAILEIFPECKKSPAEDGKPRNSA